jgi:hypothetical protein
MDHFAGLDVSVKQTSVCIVDDKGKIVREVCPSSEHLRRVRPIWKGGFGASVEQVKRLFWSASSVCVEWSVV